jgi:catechol 2,3-dioxygenase-like lactoylglutathione lyase family enzyme
MSSPRLEALLGGNLLRMPANFAPTSLDHVALWVDEREDLATFLCGHLGMHVIEETDTFTLVGIDAKLGKLTLFDAEGPRQRGALARVVLRVNDLDSALESLPFDVPRRGDGVAAFEAPAGLPLGLTEAEGREFDLDHVVLGLEDPNAALACLEELGFDTRADGTAVVDDRYVRIVRGHPADGDRPLLNHLALLVDDARGVQNEAEGAGLEVDDVKDAKNTFAVFLRGPEGVRIEYVEHKPGFALV